MTSQTGASRGGYLNLHHGLEMCGLVELRTAVLIQSAIHQSFLWADGGVPKSARLVTSLSRELVPSTPETNLGQCQSVARVECNSRTGKRSVPVIFKRKGALTVGERTQTQEFASPARFTFTKGMHKSGDGVRIRRSQYQEGLRSAARRHSSSARSRLASPSARSILEHALSP